MRQRSLSPTLVKSPSPPRSGGEGRGPLRSNGRVRLVLDQRRPPSWENENPPHPPRATRGSPPSAPPLRGRRGLMSGRARRRVLCHAEQHRQEPLLDGPLPAARQVDGAADRGDPAHGAAVARRGSGGGGGDLRHGGRVPPDPAAIERPAGQPDRLPGARRQQPLLDRELDRRGAAQRPRGAQQHHGRCVGEPERAVARAQQPAHGSTAPRSIAAR